MHDPAAVRNGEPVEDLFCDCHDDVGREGSDGFDDLCEVSSHNKLHDHVIGILVGLKFVKGDDIGMVEVGLNFSFCPESRQFLGIGDKRGIQYLDGDATAELRVLGLIHRSHSALSDL